MMLPGDQEVSRLTRLDCVKALKESPVSVVMRIRHYFTRLILIDINY